MLCPVERSVLKAREKGTVQFFSCEICQGFWFGRGELAALFKTWSSGNVLPKKKVFAGKTLHSASRRSCPSCPGKELKVKIIDGVEIDFCPRCRGIWLDAGELDLIITRFARKKKLASFPADGSDLFASDPSIVVDLADLIFDLLGHNHDWATDAASALLDFIGEALSSIDF